MDNHFKSLSLKLAGAGHAPDGTPSDVQLSLINNLTVRPFKAKELYVRTVYVAHNGIDRDIEVFDDDLLADFAKSLPAKGLFVKHPAGWDGDSGPGLGAWFEADVVTMGLDEARQALGVDLQFPPSTQQAKILQASFYIVRNKQNAPRIDDIDAGVAKHVSIGFNASSRVPIAGAKDEVLAHRWESPGEALETSLVWLGAQPGAGIAKYYQPNSGENDMGEKNKGGANSGQNETKVTIDASEYAALTQHKANDESTIAILGDEDLSEVMKFADAGRKYYDNLLDDVTKGARLAGMGEGDSEEQVKALRKTYEGMPTPQLETLKASFAAAKAPAGTGTGTITGGNPNPDNSGDQGADGGLRDASKTAASLGRKSA